MGLCGSSQGGGSHHIGESADATDLNEDPRGSACVRCSLDARGHSGEHSDHRGRSNPTDVRYPSMSTPEAKFPTSKTKRVLTAFGKYHNPHPDRGRDVRTRWWTRTQPRQIGPIWQNRHRYGMTYKMLDHLHRRQALLSSDGTPMSNVRDCGAFVKISPRIPGTPAPGVRASNVT